MLYGYHCVNGTRKHMEGAILAHPSLRNLNSNLKLDIAFFGILDGHGGRGVVDFVEANLPLEIANQLSLLSGDMDYIIKQACNLAFKIIDQRIINELPDAKDGCTALIALVTHDYFYIVNMGDSSAHLCRIINSLVHSIPLNDVHKTWVNEEKERILSMGGLIEGGRVNGILQVTRSFGDLHLKKYGIIAMGNYKKFQIDYGLDKFVIMACDGFWNSMGSLDACNKTIQFLKDSETFNLELVKDNTNILDKVCQKLIDLALSNKLQDNVSVLIICINDTIKM